MVLGKCFLRGLSCHQGDQGDQWCFRCTPRTEEAESRGIVFPLNSDSELQVLLKMRNQGHWAPLLGMYRKKLLPIKASGTKLNQCPQLAGVLLSVAQWWRVWKLHRWAGGGDRAGDRLGYVLVLSGSPSEQEALAHEELAELRTWSGW